MHTFQYQCPTWTQPGQAVKHPTFCDHTSLQWSQLMTPLLRHLGQQYVDAALAAQGFHQARGEAIRRARAREPRACVGSLVDFHARAFVFALDNFAKMIAQLALVAGDASGVPPKLAKVGKSFDKAFPGAKDVRDSLHHLEDRLLRLKGAGKELKKKKLVPIRGPLVVGQVSGDDYAMTTADGVEGIVTINPASLAELKAHLDSTLAAFTWLGEPLDMMKW